MFKANYTQANYDEDLKLTNFVLLKKFKKSQFEDIEQIIQDCLFDLYQARQLFDSFKSKYSSLACKVIHNRLLKQLNFDSRSMRKTKNSLLSLDEDLGEFCLADLIGNEMQVDEIGVVDMIKKVLSKSKNTNYVKSCYLYILGYCDKEVAIKLNISHQVVNRYKQKFREELRNELAKIGYEI